MPKFIEEEEKKPIREGELLRQAGVVLCLVLGAVLQRAGIGIGAAAAFIAAAICAVSWILFVRKEKK